MFDSLRRVTADAVWKQAQHLARGGGAVAPRAQEALRPLPAEAFVALYWLPGSGAFVLETVPGHPKEAAFRREAQAALAPIGPLAEGDDPQGDVPVPVLFAPDWNLPGLQKRAYSRFLRDAGKAILAFPSEASKHIPFAGSPLAMLLAGGLLGAGLGYGGGWAAEQLLPDRWQRGRLRKTLAVIGGLGGVVPGALGWLMNAGLGKGFTDPTPWYVPAYDEKAASALPGPVDTLRRYVEEHVPASSRWKRWMEITAQGAKVASTTGALGDVWEAPIPVPELQNTLWNDPSVASRLYPSQQAALSGTLMGASLLAGNPQAGRGASVITPMDVGRMTAGMGSGYLSGLLVGKALGLLTGMPDQTQETLKRTGVYAGILANLAPKVFGL